VTEAHCGRAGPGHPGPQVGGLKKLVKPKAKRPVIEQVMERFGLNLRRRCVLMGLSRTSFAYKPVIPPYEETIRKRLKEQAQTRRRFGCPRLHVMLRREGFRINHK
jgi:putative transposase